MSLLPLTPGLTWAPLKSPCHLYALGQVCLAPPLPPGSCKPSSPRPRPCHVSWPHGTGHSFPWPCVAVMCAYVSACVCVCSMQFVPLRLIAPSPTPSMSRTCSPWLQSTVSWKRGAALQRAGSHHRSGRVCFVEQNVNPSLDGLLDLFN